VPVAHGPATDRVGRGGTGAGTGTGAGSGSADGAAGAPMSVATIKTRAMPRGDFSYLGAGKDYPAEARAAGISGQLRVRLLVDARGRVATATPLGKPLGYGLDEFALRQARLIEFEPARDTADQPVASIVVWTFHMELPR
jgi:TonB family protein